MRESLADNLNLIGTARHNLVIRRELRLARMSTDAATLNETAKVSAAWECVIACCNHAELQHVNSPAAKCGVNNQLLPFKGSETPVEDTGERFFQSV